MVRCPRREKSAERDPRGCEKGERGGGGDARDDKGGDGVGVWSEVVSLKSPIRLPAFVLLRDATPNLCSRVVFAREEERVNVTL